MAVARDKTEWNRAASIIATILNVNRGEKENPVAAADITPYGENKKADSGMTKMKLTPQNLHLLRGLAGKQAVRSR